ncbi:hypothetical protein [Lysobacter gummosus]|uniref:hypothetical protein n=1 Tax=Lysobacter gummosus TaxID=262324 RepID=UPI003628F282
MHASLPIRHSRVRGNDGRGGVRALVATSVTANQQSRTPTPKPKRRTRRPAVPIQASRRIRAIRITPRRVRRYCRDRARAAPCNRPNAVRRRRSRRR